MGKLDLILILFLDFLSPLSTSNIGTKVLKWLINYKNYNILVEI